MGRHCDKITKNTEHLEFFGVRINGKILIGAMLTIIASACKKQPVKTTDGTQHLQSSALMNLTSADGRLRSFAVLGDLTTCGPENKGQFAFIASERLFYRCNGSEFKVSPRIDSAQSVSVGMNSQNKTQTSDLALMTCRSFELGVDIADTLGAEAASDVSFMGVSCDDGDGYLIKKDSGIVPQLVMSSFDAATGTVQLRSTRIIPKSPSGDGLRRSGRIVLPRAVTIDLAAMPRELDMVPGGDASKGSVAYVRFNDGAVTCSYRSETRETYKIQQCTASGGGTTTPDGSQIDMETSLIQGVSDLELVVDEARSGFITTVELSVKIHEVKAGGL